MEWVSVKDKLPEIDDQVIVSDGVGVCVACYDPDDDCWIYGDAPCLNSLPTHWMPLPEPPSVSRATESNSAVAEIDHAIHCLAIQVPESVYDDVKAKWDTAKAMLTLATESNGGRQGISQQPLCADGATPKFPSLKDVHEQCVNDGDPSAYKLGVDNAYAVIADRLGNFTKR